MGNESQCGTSKSREPRSGSRAICLFRTAIHFPWTEKKKDTHSLYLQCLQQRFLLKFSEQSKKFKFSSEIGNLTLFPDKTIHAYSFSKYSAWINGEKGDLSCMFFNSHFNSNNTNSILELNYMNFFYKNEILSHHEYTECRAAECPVSTNRNTDRKTRTTRIERWPWHC